MTTVKYDLLHEPLLSWRDAGRQRHLTTLPGILARLATGELGDFPRLRAHQYDPWCMFLTQLAAIALCRGRVTAPHLSEDQWRDALLGLTEGVREPWCLVVDDLSKSAFMQPAVPEHRMEDWKVRRHPDDLDVLETAKVHDVKRSLVRPEALEAWIIALVTLQTMQGYSGGAGGLLGIVRMNTGAGSRARVGLSPDLTVAARFRRDCSVLVDTWRRLCERGFNHTGVALTWLPPWDGTGSLPITALAPHFIEICRRVRFTHVAGVLQARYTTTRSRRCADDVDGGDVGDPWLPIARGEGKALSVSGRGFDYELVTRLLQDGEFEAPASQKLRSDDPESIWLIAAAMARGKSQTNGLHWRALPLVGRVRRLLGDPAAASTVGSRATRQVERARAMRKDVLFPALMKLATGDKPPIADVNRRATPDAFAQRVDEIFFSELFRNIDDPEEQAVASWERLLLDTAERELEQAIQRCSVPAQRWYEAVSNAEAMFRGCLRRRFPTLTESLSKEHRTEEAHA